MPGFAAWKLIVPLAGVAIVGLLVARPGDFPGLSSAPASESRFQALGYLTSQELPDAVALLAPPPAAGSEAMKKDEQARAAALPLHGTRRYGLAAADANRDQAATAVAFQCAFGTEISPARTPALYGLLSKVRLDVRAAAYPAKSHFGRPRPFEAYNTQTCFPPDDQNVRGDGSYPSARGAVGWAYALALAEVNPARAQEIMQRGRDFGQSRIVCDEEWLSDVEAGREIAAIVMQHIQDKPAFRADVETAKREVAAALKSGAKPAGCQNETLALATP